MLSPLDRQILRIALPSIVTNITVPLLGLVDLSIVGHIGNAGYIGAIAVGGMIFNVVYWIFGFLRMGTSGMTSQALGGRDFAEVVRLLLRSLAVALAVALCVVVFRDRLFGLAISVISPPSDIIVHVRTYFYICVWGAPAMLCLYSLTGWFIGMQNTRAPMLVSIVQNVVNIAASLCLVLVAGMKVDGVAFGTLIAQYVGFAVSLSLFFRHYFRLRRYFSPTGLFGWPAMIRFFRVNRDIFVRTLFLVAVNLYFLSAGASHGALVLAVNTLLMQLFTLFSYVMDGFAYAGEALCGRYHGAGNRPALHSTVRRLFRWGLLTAFCYTLVYAFGGRAFLSLLTDDADVLRASVSFFPWAVAIPAAGMAAFIWDGVFIGLTATRDMMLSSVLSALLFFLVCRLAVPSFGNHALWLAFVFYLFCRGAIQTWLYMANKKKVPSL